MFKSKLFTVMTVNLREVAFRFLFDFNLIRFWPLEWCHDRLSSFEVVSMTCTPSSGRIKYYNTSQEETLRKRLKTSIYSHYSSCVECPHLHTVCCTQTFSNTWWESFSGTRDHPHWGIVFQTNIIFRLMIWKRPETPQILTREEFMTCKQTVIDSDISFVLQFKICNCNSENPVHDICFSGNEYYSKVFWWRDAFWWQVCKNV